MYTIYSCVAGIDITRYLLDCYSMEIGEAIIGRLVVPNGSAENGSVGSDQAD